MSTENMASVEQRIHVVRSQMALRASCNAAGRSGCTGCICDDYAENVSFGGPATATCTHSTRPARGYIAAAAVYSCPECMVLNRVDQLFVVVITVTLEGYHRVPHVEVARVGSSESRA